MEPRHEAAAICRREIAVNLAEELALTEECESLRQSIAISSTLDPMKDWMLERLAAAQRDLERAREARLKAQNAMFEVVEKALLAGDTTLTQTYWECVPRIQQTPEKVERES